MTQQEQINEQIELAKKAIAQHGYGTSAVIKVCKLSPKSRKTWVGFHFEDGRFVGETGKHEDGTLYTIAAIVSP